MKVLLSILLLFCTALSAQIVPKPVSFEAKQGVFEITADTKIQSTEFGADVAALAGEYLGLKVEKGISGDNAVTFSKIENAELGTEGYLLEVSSTKITVKAPTVKGLVYGFQSLRQLLPAKVYGNKKASGLKVKACFIKDYPTFRWRGMMLDVSRYWFTKDFVLRYLDIMAAHKMNVLHWHIVDDAGWRIEIKKYPKLTEVGAFRGEGEARYGGFYSQEEIKEIVKYATVRGITIVPEIEVPAHTLAAIVAYPYLSCHGRQLKMPTRHSISKDLYCPGKETTWEFLKDVMDEVCELFPGTFIHIGGDEAKYPNWNRCKDCQALMKKENLKDAHALHGYFNSRLEKYLATKGRKIIGWDEILKCGASEQAGLMIWRNRQAAIDGAKRGNTVVMAPTGSCYFDTVESKHPGEPPGTQWISNVTLKRAYEWNPYPRGLPKEFEKNIAGGNGCVWSDQFLHKPTILPDRPGQGTRHSESYIEYLSLPRMAALAEVNWTSLESRSWEDFTQRMKKMYNRYISAGWTFRLPMPVLTVEKQADGKTLVQAQALIADGVVRYSLDGKDPHKDSPVLKSGALITDMENFRASTFSRTGSHRSLSTMNLDLPDWIRSKGAKVGQWKSGTLTADVKEIIFDATGIISKNGGFNLTFIQIKGTKPVKIHALELVRNDQTVIYKPSKFKDIEFETDRRGGRLGIKVTGYETGATLKLRVKMSVAEGADSEGYVLLRSGK